LFFINIEKKKLIETFNLLLRISRCKLLTKKFKNEKALVDWLVTEIMDEKIIGFFDGRMEFGPRALGNRSILADPRNEGMKNRLNERVKHRESFRPFAASVLWEYQSEWFEKSFFSPNMEAVFKVNSSLRNKVAGVVHADGSCRIQSVTQEHQPLFWNLIEAFRKRTGIPMLINTSFNNSEPIVCTPSDAIRCFSGSEMDHLIIGLNVYSRKHASLSLTA
jgi:carbamoyltransferase